MAETHAAWKHACSSTTRRASFMARAIAARADHSDAELVTEGKLERIDLGAESYSRFQDWYFPGPADCRVCHLPAAGGVLGVNARQLNRDLVYASGRADNQLRTWNHIGMFDVDLDSKDIEQIPRLAAAGDRSRSLEDAARSYLDANCAHCHRPDGAAADFDARFTTAIALQQIIGAPARINFGIDNARLIAPHDPWRSMILARVETLEPTRMPPLAHQVVDENGVRLLRAWIQSLSGPPVVAPPSIAPRGGDYRRGVRVVLAHPDENATLRYTLDGTVPGKASAIYAGPITIERSTTLRAAPTSRASREASRFRKPGSSIARFRQSISRSRPLDRALTAAPPPRRFPTGLLRPRCG